MSLYNIIQSYGLTNDLKLISPFVESGTSKLKKKEKEELHNTLINYQKSDREYFGFELDDEQYEVVKSKPNQNIRILAGAGSGKTTTILCRVKYLVDN